MSTLRGAVLQNRLSEGKVKENLNCSAEGREREFSELVGSGAPGWVNPRVGARGVSCRFPLEAVMELYPGPMSLWTDQKRSMGLERRLRG